ncbi:MAG: cystathionine gamma-synthase [Elusimicrobiota bacterium]
MKSSKNFRFSTLAVHAGQFPDPTTGAVMTPIYQTSTYVQKAPGRHKGFDYSRTANPTRSALEAALTALEGARHGLCFSSGMAAISTVVMTLNAGDHVVSCDDLYGGTYRAFTKVFTRLGINFTFVNASNPRAVEKSLTSRTRMIWIETPSNPLLKITDIRLICALARRRGVLAAVDNTFASPALQRPLSLGAGLVVHSTTKYLGGHSDVVGGFIATDDQYLYEKLKFLQNSVGAIPGPMDCFLTLRGVKTLAVRMERHCANAMAIARHLNSHPEVERVHYPGLAAHPGHRIAKSQMSGFGGMLSFELKGGISRAKRMIVKTNIFCLAESLGGVESLIGHPASMTHAAIPRQERMRAGLSDGLIRLSVGVEDVRDMITDLDQAISKSKTS